MPPKTEPKAKAKGKAKVAKKEGEEEDFGIERVAEPDKAAYDKAYEEITAKVDALQAKAKAITEKINAQSAGGDEFSTQKSALLQQLTLFNTKIKELSDKKAEINQEVTGKRQEAKLAKDELIKQKKALGYTTESDIDDRIRFLDDRLRTETLKLKEEKDILKEIADLKKRKPEIAKVKGLEATLSKVDTGASQWESLTEINSQLNEYWEGKKQVLKGLDELSAQRTEKMGDRPALIAERQGYNDESKALIEERNTLRDAFNEERKNFNEYKRLVREKQQEKWAAERKAKEDEYQKQRKLREAEKLDDQPYVTEMTLIEQTISFCKSLTGAKEEKAAEEKKEVTHNNPDGTEILMRKEDREEEFYFAPTAKKKSKSKNKSAKEGGSAKAIKHNAATFKLFDELKLEAPITTDDIPATLEKLEEQLESYKAKVKEWEETRAERKRKILEGIEEPAAEEAAEE